MRAEFLDEILSENSIWLSTYVSFNAHSILRCFFMSKSNFEKFKSINMDSVTKIL